MLVTHLDALAIHSRPNLLAAIRSLGGEQLYEFLMEGVARGQAAVQTLSKNDASPLGDTDLPPIQNTPIVGKLHMLREGACKNRIIGISDY
jgi:hypothetical protein